MPLPKLVVFDLDFTLWDCGGLWIDCTTHPFQIESDGTIVDRANRQMRLYPEVPELLDEIEESGFAMGLASRTNQPDWARDLLDLMGIRERFAYEEIYPSSKIQHFTTLADAAGIEFNEMLFFDDEHRNIAEVSDLGVKCVEVPNGLDRSRWEEGLSLF